MARNYELNNVPFLYLKTVMPIAVNSQYHEQKIASDTADTIKHCQSLTLSQNQRVLAATERVYSLHAVLALSASTKLHQQQGALWTFQPDVSNV